jgi:hypothetical protein
MKVGCDLAQSDLKVWAVSLVGLHPSSKPMLGDCGSGKLVILLLNNADRKPHDWQHE